MLDDLTLSFLDQYGSLGGGQRVLLESMAAALVVGVHVTLLAPEGELLFAARAGGAQTRALPELFLRQGRKGPGDATRLGLWTARVLARHGRFLAGQDCLYVNGPRCLPAVMSVAALTGTSFCVHTHLAHRGLERRLLLAASRQGGCLALTAPSAFVADVLGQGGHPPPKLRVLENGLTGSFSDCAFEDRHSNRPVREVLVIGRLSPEKGQDALAEAARTLPRMRFHLVGASDFADPSYVEELRRRLPENVIFHGRVDDVPGLARYLGAQICLVPSRCEEAFGLAALEGMALSCITAVRPLGGLAEIAQATGALCFLDDAELLPLLARLAATPGPERTALARSQYAAVRARYGHAAFAGRLEAFVRELIRAAQRRD